MLIQQKYNGHKGMFYVGEESDRLAEMVYTMPAPTK